MADYLTPPLRGPYGTNIGDIWTMDGSEVGEDLKREKNLLTICEVFQKEGNTKPTEYIYVVDIDDHDPDMDDLIRKAKEGNKLILRARGRL